MVLAFQRLRLGKKESLLHSLIFRDYLERTINNFQFDGFYSVGATMFFQPLIASSATDSEHPLPSRTWGSSLGVKALEFVSSLWNALRRSLVFNVSTNGRFPFCTIDS